MKGFIGISTDSNSSSKLLEFYDL